MPFLSNDPLVLEYKTGITWKVVNPFTYIIDDTTKVTVPTGFCTDLTSVPQLFWNIFPPPGGMYGKAAVIHDYIYYYGTVYNYKDNINQSITRKQADQVFMQAMNDLNVPWYTRYTLYIGLRVGGWNTWNKYRENKQ